MTTSDQFMARYGARLVDNGYPIIPILPGSKKPGRFQHGAWGDYPGWPRHGDRATTLHEVEIWSSWPDAAIGLAGGAVVGIDIDVLDPDLAYHIEQLARSQLGDTPLLRIGKAPKRLLVYRAKTAFAGPRRAPLEIIGHGRQFVAFARHPDTGQPYLWPDESPLSVALEDLPAVDEVAVNDWLAAAHALIPDALRPQSLIAPAARSIAHSPQPGTFEAVQAALAFIPNADLDYDSWVRIGLAIKGALGDDGAGLFAAWSAQSAKHIDATTLKAWASFNPTKIGAGTLYHLALERGWRPDPALVLDGSAAPQAPHPAAQLLAGLTAAPTAAPAEPLARFDLPLPRGLLADLIDYMVTTARRPQPELAIGASLCALGTLMGRQYRTTSNLRSNLYIVGIADSGSGKNHSREIINELFVAAGLTHHLGGNKIASGAGLLTALHRQPSLLLQIDEFGMFLHAAADRKRSPRHITEILDNMTELYTSAGGIYLGAEYANRDGRNERRDINQPCLSVYGTTTPLHFWGALQSANVVDGSLARFIIIQSSDDYPDENDQAGIRTPPRALIDGLKAIASAGGRKSTGNHAGMTHDLATVPEPITVAMDGGARQIFQDLSKEMTARLRASRGSLFSSILARQVENATKLALVLAVSQDPAAPLIRRADAEWANAFMRWYTERTMIEVERRISDNDIERNHKRLMEFIRAAGPAGMTKSELIRRSQFMDKRQRDEVLQSLVEAGLITTTLRPTTPKPVAILIAAGGS